MKLIDADKLPATCTLTIVNGHMELSGWLAAERISEAPIVEAIPVEWIEKWIETDRNTKLRTPYYYKRLFRSRLKMMLEDWRKENGS